MKIIKIFKEGVMTNANDDPALSDEEKNDWLEREIANGSFGKPERWVREKDEDVSGALETREVEDRPAIEAYEELIPEREYTNIHGEVVIVPEHIAQRDAVEAVTHTEYLLPAQYKIVEVNLDEDPEHLLQQCHQKRKQEYPPISEFADAYVKHMNGDSTQLEAYASKCLEVKQKHPKP